MAKLKGRAWKFGKNVNTDVIIPARYVNNTDANELGKHCMENIHPGFAQQIARGDIIVADANFGCGSSREEAPVAIKAAGISAIVAGSFARIFYRNSINIGLPILECPEAAEGFEAGDEVEIDLDAGLVRNVTRGREFQAAGFPPFMQQIIDRGGLIGYVEERLAARATE